MLVLNFGCKLCFEMRTLSIMFYGEKEVLATNQGQSVIQYN